MIVSNKKISVIVLIICAVSAVAYFFLWFGWVEISISASQVKSFTLKTREKIYECTNPCRLKIRAGETLWGQVLNTTMPLQDSAVKAKIKFLATTKINLSPRAELPFLKFIKQDPAKIKTQKSRENSAKKNVKKHFGPVLVAADGDFVIFAVKTREFLNIFIKAGTQTEKILTLNDNFQELFLEKNFALQPNGLLIPAQKRFYFYDFATQRKFLLLNINSLRTKNVSVNDQGNAILFNLKEKRWQKYLSANADPQNYSEHTNFAGFWQNQELEIRDNFLLINRQKKFRLPADLKLAKNDDIYLQGDKLVVRQDFLTWELDLTNFANS